MKIILVLTTLFMLVCILITACNPEPAISERGKLAYKISGRVAEQLKNKYDLDVIGVGLSGSGDQKTIKTFILDLTLNHLVTKEEGMDLILNCVEDFLHEINDSEEIRPYLVQFPFTYENIGLRILFYSDARYEPTVDPNIGSISLNDGIIKYKIANIENRFTNKSVEKESYQEALKLQNQTN